MRIHILDESHIRQRCEFCNTVFSDDSRWKSEFDCGEHYKICKCTCGKDTWIRMSFDGSGHDDWDGKKSWESVSIQEAIDSKITCQEVSEASDETLDDQVSIEEVVDNS